MKCLPPGCGETRAELVHIQTGATQQIDLRKMKLSWERTTSQPADAVLTTNESTSGEAWCCPWELQEWCYELHIYRDGSRVATYDYHSIFRNPETNADVLYFTTRMGLVLRRFWWSDSTFTYEATDAFARILREADICDGLGLSQQAYPTGYEASISGVAMRPLSAAITQLTSGTLDYTEYSIDDYINVVRYGDLTQGTHTGVTLTENDWKNKPPTIGVNGQEQASAVIVTNDLAGTTTDPVIGWWPRNPDGSIKKTEGASKRWIPLVIEQKDVKTTGEASDIARRSYGLRQSGRVITTSGTSTLSERFPICINTLIPGAVFDVSMGSGCNQAEGQYYIRTLQVDVDGGIETAVKADLREIVQV